ncbi:MAG: hypothetical protein PHQ04_10205 [Opitutaceae bacterium]|nr:hypothetical protein [Opitutaceae bacterium]
MNKTLLLIICDFLLLNLLALTRWEKAEPSHAQLTSAAPKAATADPAANAEMVELMRISLEDEKNTRDQLSQQLQITQADLQQREQSLTNAQQQQEKLQETLAATQDDVRGLEQKYGAATRENALTREQLAGLQREIEERRAEAERQKAEFARLEQQNGEARKRIEALNAAVGAAQQENKLLAVNLTEAKQQIEIERQERAKVQAQTQQLAQGVGQLAEKSGELTQEIRDNRPINPNVIFSDFLVNRVGLNLSTRRPGLFGPARREKDCMTVLVNDGRQIYALLHVADTPFSLIEIPVDFDLITGSLARGSFTLPVKELRFFALDPRLVGVPVDASMAALIGAKIYNLATDPFKFPNAVLVRATDGKYGETSFRIDSQNPGFVKVDNRIVTRLFGEFAPSRGDLVFSQSGELIGLMVNSDYCAVLGNLTAAHTLKTGEDVIPPKTSPVLTALSSRWQSLPLELQ